MVRKIFISLLLILFASSITEAAAPSRLQNLRYSQGPSTLRVVIDLTKEFKYKEFYLENPSRLVVDIEGAVLSSDVKKEFNLDSPHAKRVRLGQFNSETVRVVIETDAETKIFVLEGGPSGCRLVIDIMTPDKSEKSFETVKPKTPQTSNADERERELREQRERQEQEEKERRLQEARERKAEKERLEKEEKERKEKEEKERKEKERKAKEEKERKAKEEKAEKERKAKEEKERKAKEKEKSKSKDKEIDEPFKTDVDVDLDKLMTLKGKVIAIDPGHGGNDAGAIGPSGVMEKTVTLNVALELEKMLKAEGAEVIMTRRTDKTVSPKGASASAIEELQARCDVANRAKADIFISIHADSFTNSSARGTTGYYYSQTEGPMSIKLADCIRKALCEQIRTPSRGTKPCNFYVVKNTDMAATLIELAFISNPEEEKIMSSKEGVLKCAQGIFDGIEDFFG